ncbi:HNH endonuclease [Gordonia phage Wooper]|nr:HNH endonuclease [Gordonia phage Wooper]
MTGVAPPPGEPASSGCSTVTADGSTALCHECGAVVSFDTMCVDRHPIPGEQGGRYTRDNIAVHCVGCSGRQGQRRTVAILAERRACAD